MHEEDLRILDGQIERTKQKLQNAHNETLKYELEKRLKVYEDMRLDLLIQIEHYKPRQRPTEGATLEPETILQEQAMAKSKAGLY